MVSSRRFLLTGTLFATVILFSGLMFVEGKGVNDYSLYLNSTIISANQVLEQEKEADAKVLSNPHLYILQFNGPIIEQEKQLVQQYGVEIGDYIPNFAFIVRTTPKIIQKVKALPFIYRAIRYKATMKLSKALAEKRNTEVFNVRMITFAENHDVYQLQDSRIISREKRSLTAKLKQSELAEFINNESIIFAEEVPEYQLFNDRAAEIMNVPAAWESSLTGEGQIVAVCDTGLDTGKNDETMNQDFQGRIKAIYALGRRDNASDPHGHGTHVAGSVLGSGANSDGNFKGLAYKANLVFQSVLDSKGSLGGIPEDLTKLFEQPYLDGARIHTNSWGLPYEYKGAVYSANSSEVDRFMWEHKDMLILFSAGNSGDYDRNGVTNYNTVCYPGTAKNCLTVGASESNRAEKGIHADNIEEIAYFSSRGWANPDGRIKPDVVAPGTWILSVKSSLASDGIFWGTYNKYYAYMGGTSMSTPLTAGAAALVRENYMKQGIIPQASLIKATLINGTLDMGFGSPSRDQGWGRINLKQSILKPLVYENESQALATNETISYSFEIKNSDKLVKTTLAWTDYPGSPTAEKVLVNDLDLEILAPDGQIYHGNDFTAPFNSEIDRTNNVENIYIKNPLLGVYKINVKAYNVPNGPQPYSLFVNVDNTPPPPPPEMKMKLQLKNNNTQLVGNSIRPQIRLVNVGNNSLPLKNVKLRYYYTVDGDKEQNFWCDNAGIYVNNNYQNLSGVQGSFVKLTEIKEQADCYLEISLNSETKLIPGGILELQLRISKVDWSNYQQDNDYSYSDQGNNFIDWEKITAYYNGEQKWGIEP